MRGPLGVVNVAVGEEHPGPFDGVLQLCWRSSAEDSADGPFEDHVGRSLLDDEGVRGVEHVAEGLSHRGRHGATLRDNK